MSVDVKVPGGFRQPQSDPVNVGTTHDLTSEPRVFLQKRSNVQKIVLFFRRLRQYVEMVGFDVAMAGGARQGGFASPFHVDAVAMREIKSYFSDFTFHGLFGAVGFYESHANRFGDVFEAVIAVSNDGGLTETSNCRTP